jgi:mannosyltransferase OCH1-like enzyme
MQRLLQWIKIRNITKRLITSYKDPKSQIENNIFQTHESIHKINKNPVLVKATNTWKPHNKQFNYFFYNNVDCDNFIKQNFPENVYSAYQKLPLGVMKADFWRYCVVYHYGGIYSDSDTKCLINPSIMQQNAQLVIVPENNHSLQDWTFATHLCQWTFAAPKNSPFLKSVIDLSVKRIHEWDGKMIDHIVFHLTGPSVFTDGIENYLKSLQLPTFPNNRNDYTGYQTKVSPILYVFPSSFHKNCVKHLFTGCSDTGWWQQVDALRKKQGIK